MKKRIPAWALAAALALASCAATERPAIEPAAFTPEVELTGRQARSARSCRGASFRRGTRRWRG